MDAKRTAINCAKVPVRQAVQAMGRKPQWIYLPFIQKLFEVAGWVGGHGKCLPEHTGESCDRKQAAKVKIYRKRIRMKKIS